MRRLGISVITWLSAAAAMVMLWRPLVRVGGKPLMLNDVPFGVATLVLIGVGAVLAQSAAAISPSNRPTRPSGGQLTGADARAQARSQRAQWFSWATLAVAFASIAAMVWLTRQVQSHELEGLQAARTVLLEACLADGFDPVCRAGGDGLSWGWAGPAGLLMCAILLLVRVRAAVPLSYLAAFVVPIVGSLPRSWYEIRAAGVLVHSQSKLGLFGAFVLVGVLVGLWFWRSSRRLGWWWPILIGVGWVAAMVAVAVVAESGTPYYKLDLPDAVAVAAVQPPALVGPALMIAFPVVAVVSHFVWRAADRRRTRN